MLGQHPLFFNGRILSERFPASEDQRHPCLIVENARELLLPIRGPTYDLGRS